MGLSPCHPDNLPQVKFKVQHLMMA